MQPDAYRLNYLHEERHWWFLARREIIISTLSQLQNSGRLPRNDLHILDYGCGTGGLTQALSLFGQVLAVDDSLAALDFCRKRNLQNLQLIKSPSELPTETFDLIGSFDVLEHVEDDEALLAEFFRMLTPNGTVLITVPAYRWLWGGEDEVSNHFRRYTKRDLQNKMRRAGFSIIQATYFNTLLFPPIAAKRLWNRAFQKNKTVSDVGASPPGINSVLCRLFAAERLLLQHINLPFGVSILAAAAKAGDRRQVAQPRFS